MKLYFIYSKNNKESIYKSINKQEVLNYFKNEKLEKKYYKISSLEDEKIKLWAKGELFNSKEEIDKLIFQTINKKPGRPFGTKKEPTIDYHRRIKKEWVEILDKKIKELKSTYK